MSNHNIKYAVLQPLTGGAYFGAESAFGHPAEFIISYPGFDAPKYNKEGKLVDAGNEYNLIKYLEKHDRMVPYYQFDRKPFQNDIESEVKLLKEGKEVEPPNFEGIDYVIAVPVCSGLSSATRGASQETLDARNCNMKFLTHYALGTIKPKVFVFENAPKLSSAGGAFVRHSLEEIANKFDYSVAYYKTDTQLHDNCQKRPRTFVYFFKNDANHPGTPKLGFENKHISVSELLSRIPKRDDDPMNITLPESYCNISMMSFAKKVYGEDWRKNTKSPTLLCDIITDNKLDDWADHVKQDTEHDQKLRDGMIRGIEHMKHKMSMGKGFYTVSPTLMRNDTMPAAMFKTIPSCYHYSEDRLYTMREWLTSMGMPFDFDMYGEVNRYFAKIGQNVPARTAKFITEEAIKVIENWDSIERINDIYPVLFNNMKQTISKTNG